MLAAAPVRLNRRVTSIVENAVLTMQRTYLLERRLRETAVDFDWNRI
jgi:hypothetical protein